MFALSVGSPWTGMSLYTTLEGIQQWCAKWARDNPKLSVENFQIDNAPGNRCRQLERKLLAALPQGSYAAA